MSYQNNSRYHNTRQSNRFNRPGSFIPASSSNHPTYEVSPAPAPPRPPQPQQPAKYEPEPKPEPLPQPVEDPFKETDIEMETASTGDESSTSNSRMPFFKSKLFGIRKISNKERRRRQNTLLRRLTTPKNALMCINEMLPNEHVTNQFKVEANTPEGFFGNNAHSFTAELVLSGVTYKGHGENKLAARNAAAEQAIRDIVLRRMQRAPAAPAAPAAPDAPGDPGPLGEDAETLPMIQLLSFALHKLFAEWEGAGHRVPQLRPKATAQQGGEEASAAGAAEAGAAAGRAVAGGPGRQPRRVPDHAAAMHPAMLLTVLRPSAAYRELPPEGERPNLIFTIAVDLDDKTFIGKALNKREARKQAARAACKDILDITFDDEK